MNRNTRLVVWLVAALVGLLAYPALHMYAIAGPALIAMCGDALVCRVRR